MPMQRTGDPAGGYLKKFSMGNYSNSYSALNKARELESKLKHNDSPILAGSRPDLLCFVTICYEKIYGNSDFPMTFLNDLVRRIELPSDARANPDKYIKPLDIVLAINRKLVHACVYLGNKNVCHVRGECNGKVRVDSWSSFLSVISTDKIIRYHPVIAFKKPDIIIRHIAKSIEGTSNYFVRGVKNISGSFSIWRDESGNSNNCENFTNVCVLGLNFSELDDRRHDKNQGIMIEVESSIKETTRKLDELASYPSSRVNEIKEYINRGNQNRINSYVNREGILMDERIEVKPKDWYRLNSNAVGIDGISLLIGGLGRLFL